MTIKYEKVITPSGNTVITATFDDSNRILSIPCDPANSDYQAYLEHEAEAK